MHLVSSRSPRCEDPMTTQSTGRDVPRLTSIKNKPRTWKIKRTLDNSESHCFIFDRTLRKRTPLMPFLLEHFFSTHPIVSSSLDHRQIMKVREHDSHRRDQNLKRNQKSPQPMGHRFMYVAFYKELCCQKPQESLPVRKREWGTPWPS